MCDADIAFIGCSASHRQNPSKYVLNQYVFEKKKKLLQNGIINLVFRLSQPLGIALQS